MITREDLVINETTYQRCVRTFALLEGRLGLNVRLHCDAGAIEAGQIFLFNHFARFETIIPQYLIFKETGAYCRTLGSSSFFNRESGLSRFLMSIGGVPNNLDGVLPFLAAEILRGRKAIVFPEGGMIKDRRVVDDKGEFSVYSPTARAFRKHHTGAAAIALTLEIFKKRILSVHEAGEIARLERWVEALRFDSIDALLAAAGKPTLIVPGNITFHPLRVEENLLKRGAQILFRGLRDRAREELLIEGNILLKDTDMDIRLGPPVSPEIPWRWWERRVLDRSFAQIDSLERLFDLNVNPEKWVHRAAKSFVGRTARRVRDQCMQQIYRQVTINMSHLASDLMIRLVEGGVTQIDERAFRRVLYLAIKFVQQEPGLFLHPSLVDPEVYEGLLDGSCTELDQLISLACKTGLLAVEDASYHFLDGLTVGHDFHKVRLRNTVQVYANEIAAVPAAGASVARGLEQSGRLNGAAFAMLRFDDELLSAERARERYSEPRHRQINAQETATESGDPYLFLSSEGKKLGVVLIHGLLASPAELRSFGEVLQQRGYPVMGVRLKGHGTSPWDLRDRSWRDWMSSVRRGYEILSSFVESVCLVGFSVGGLLALRLAADSPPGLAGVATVSAPLKLRNKNLMFVPVVHRANKLAEWTSTLEGVMPFRLNNSERPQINYRHIPVRALFELRRATDDLRRHLRNVICPVAVLQGSGDPVVAHSSATTIYEKIGAAQKSLQWIESDRHGVLGEDLDSCQANILSFIETLDPASQADEPADREAPPAGSTADPAEDLPVSVEG